MQLGMLGDGGDESLALTRIADDETTLADDWCEDCMQLLQRLLTLYGDAKFCFESGFTKHILDVLKKRRIVYVRGKTRSLGGHPVAGEILERCRLRMLGWVHLVKVTLQAEYPDFEAAAAFRVFSSKCTATEDEVGTMLHTLATFFGAGFHDLQREYHQLRPGAKHSFVQQPGRSVSEHWLPSSKSRFRDFPLTRRILRSVEGFGGSSSGVEQAFSIAQWALEGRKSWLSGNLENDHLVLICDRDNYTEKELAKKAQEIWVQCGYGRPGASGLTGIGAAPGTGREARRDAGVKRPQPLDAPTEAGFIKRRRAELAEATARDADAFAQARGQAPLPRGPLPWSDAHKQEARFALEKRFDGLIDALISGEVSVDSLTPELAAIAVAELRRRAKAGRGKTRGRITRRNVPLVSTLRRAHIFVAADVCSFLGSSMVDEAIGANDAFRCANMVAANVFVVGDVLAPGQRISWHCGLAGGYLIDKAFLCSGGKNGLAIGAPIKPINSYKKRRNSYDKASNSHEQSSNYFEKHYNSYEKARSS